MRKQSIAERATVSSLHMCAEHVTNSGVQHATERAAYQTEIDHLRQQLKRSQEEAAKLREKLDTIESDHTEYLATFEAVNYGRGC